MRFHGSNGYRIEVRVSAGRSKFLPQVYVYARKGSTSVTYIAHGSLGADGSIDAHLPHVGRIAVDFDPVDLGRRRVPGNCQGRASVVERGYFRGRIELRGERGYTTVERGSAPGRVVRSFRRVCDNELTTTQPRHHGKAPSRQEGGIAWLLAGEEEGSTNFEALSFRLGSKPTIVGFTASAGLRREGMFVQSSVTVKGSAGDLAMPEPGEPKVAVATPPAPFEGSARFELTSKKTSTWEGDLAVELPAIGHVALAGPAFYSALCEDSHCTDTTPFDSGMFDASFYG